MSFSLQEHDYIGLTELPSMEGSAKPQNPISSTTKALNFKATELRLGLPGSESPERENAFKSGLMSVGAKRGFSHTIHVPGSEVDLAKSSVLYSPRSVNGVSKEAGSIPLSPKPPVQEKKPQQIPAAKAQVVGWPPIRSFRKNSMAANSSKAEEDGDAKSGAGCLYVKISMDGAPYLRKVDLKNYNCYKDLSTALEKMFSSFTTGECGSHASNRDGLNESRLTDLLRGSDYVLTYEDKDGDWMLVGDVPWEMFRDSCKRLRIMKSSDAIGLAPRAAEKSKNPVN